MKIKQFLYSLILLLTIGSCTSDTSHVYMAGKLKGVRYSDYYQVFVEGQEAHLHYSQLAPFVSFTYSGKVDIEVICPGKVQKLEILPAHLGIESKIFQIN